MIEMQVDYDDPPTTVATTTTDDYHSQEEMDYEMTELIAKIREDDTRLASSTSLDVDVEMSQACVEIDTNTLRLIVVLDTNIFVSNLSELEALAGRKRESVLFVVPWVVLQELDSLKSNRARVADKARQAIHFIHSILGLKTLTNFIFENALQVN